MPEMPAENGTASRTANVPTKIPPYEPPTIADLARVEKGGGGDAFDKKYRDSSGRDLSNKG